MSRCRYRSISTSKTHFLGYVVAIDNPLSYHIHIYWPKEVREKYFPYIIPYNYRYASEEDSAGNLDEDSEAKSESGSNNISSCNNMKEGEVYICRLNNVNSIPSADFSTTKIAYQIVSSVFRRNNNWIFLSVGDIDSYARILVDIYDIFTEASLQKLLFEGKTATGDPIVETYTRPRRCGIIMSEDDKDRLSVHFP